MRDDKKETSEGGVKREKKKEKKCGVSGAVYSHNNTFSQLNLRRDRGKHVLFIG